MNRQGAMSRNFRRQINREWPLRCGLETLPPFAGQPARLVQIAAEKRAEFDNPMCGRKYFHHARLLGQFEMPAAYFPGAHRLSPRDIKQREKDRPAKQRSRILEPLADLAYSAPGRARAHANQFRATPWQPCPQWYAAQARPAAGPVLREVRRQVQWRPSGRLAASEYADRSTACSAARRRYSTALATLSLRL